MRSPPIHRITVKELEEQFRHFDRDGDGSITLSKYRFYLKELAITKDTHVPLRLLLKTIC